MSKHDLKGVDTGKVGNNKGVNLSYDEYMRRFGPKKEIPKMDNLKDLEDFYGPNVQIPGLGKTTEQLKVELQPVGLPKDARILPDGTVLPKGASTKVTKKFADKTNFLDEYLLGGLASGLSKPVYEGYEKIDVDDLSQYKLLPDQQNRLNQALELDDSIKGGATSSTQEGVDSYLDFKKQTDTQSRKGRILDNALDFLNMRMQLPFYKDQLKDVSTFKQQQLLDAEAVKQALPNAQQARMLAASSGFATEAQALAAQQDAATRFAGLGMQRRFG
tara:strand:+ start:191 stop:1012 length:822 start_codon:yes stop_codon:yes gene_type:complete